MTEESTNIPSFVCVILVMAILVFLSMFNYDDAPSATNSFVTLFHLLALG